MNIYIVHALVNRGRYSNLGKRIGGESKTTYGNVFTDGKYRWNMLLIYNLKKQLNIFRSAG